MPVQNSAYLIIIGIIMPEKVFKFEELRIFNLQGYIFSLIKAVF